MSTGTQGRGWVGKAVIVLAVSVTATVVGEQIAAALRRRSDPRGSMTSD